MLPLYWEQSLEGWPGMAVHLRQCGAQRGQYWAGMRDGGASAPLPQTTRLCGNSQVRSLVTRFVCDWWTASSNGHVHCVYHAELWRARYGILGKDVCESTIDCWLLILGFFFFFCGMVLKRYPELSWCTNRGTRGRTHWDLHFTGYWITTFRSQCEEPRAWSGRVRSIGGSVVLYEIGLLYKLGVFMNVYLIWNWLFYFPIPCLFLSGD